MPGIKLKDGEGCDSALRRFKRAVEKSGLLSDIRRREAFEPPSERKKRAKAAAIKRFRKKQSREARGEREKGGGRSKGRATSMNTRGGMMGGANKGRGQSSHQSQH